MAYDFISIFSGSGIIVCLGVAMDTDGHTFI